MDKLKIVVTYRPFPGQGKESDYIAELQDAKAWGRGRAPREAIGDLLLNHPELFGVEISGPEQAS